MTAVADRQTETVDSERLLRRSESQLEELRASNEELAISSRHKSEFIANMSHELRTPLNTLLILAEQLADDPGHSMTDLQVEYAQIILAAGRDLLGLLNTVLDLAKVESGTATVEMAAVSVTQLHDDLVREFEHVARAKGLGFSISVAPESPSEIVTDPLRLRQILKNLISNGVKFTERGDVNVHIGLAETGWSPETESLVSSSGVVAFAVCDTGIGIEGLQQRRIFEAFAQGDRTTARLYGGTGLGLSICRQLVGLLGGEITLASTTAGAGSTFTVFLPFSRAGTAFCAEHSRPAPGTQ
jgi:signal transduction histidine kinase